MPGLCLNISSIPHCAKWYNHFEMHLRAKSFGIYLVFDGVFVRHPRGQTWIFENGSRRPFCKWREERCAVATIFVTLDIAPRYCRFFLRDSPSSQMDRASSLPQPFDKIAESATAILTNFKRVMLIRWQICCIYRRTRLATCTEISGCSRVILKCQLRSNNFWEVRERKGAG